MRTIGIVLNVRESHSADFERGFQAQEEPIWRDLESRGLLLRATPSRVDISTMRIDGAVHLPDR